jgi:hypothetical protein
MVKWPGKALLAQVPLLVKLTAQRDRLAVKVAGRFRSAAVIQVSGKGLLARKDALRSRRLIPALRSCCRQSFRSRKPRKQRLLRVRLLRVPVLA